MFEFTKVIDLVCESERKCDEHRLELFYYCETCNECVCPDCGLFGTHKAHTFRRLSEYYQTITQKIREQQAGLRQMIFNVKVKLETIDNKITEVDSKKTDKAIEVISLVELMQNSLGEALNSRVSKLYKYKDKLNAEYIRIESLLNMINESVDTQPRSLFIKKTPELQRKIEHAKEFDMNHVPEDLSEPFPSELVPDYKDCIYIIDDFTSLRNSDKTVYSDALKWNKCKWRLKIHANGKQAAQGKYLSVYVEMLKGIGTKQYDYKIEIVNLTNPCRSFSMSNTSYFAITDGWGFSKFYELDLLETEGFLSENTIIFKMYIRPPTYYGLSLDQHEYIRSAKAKIQASQLKIQKLQVKLENTLEPNEETS